MEPNENHHVPGEWEITDKQWNYLSNGFVNEDVISYKSTDVWKANISLQIT